MKDFSQGLMFGAVVGGLMALLNTPHSGMENRKKLKAYIEVNTESFEELSNDLNQLRGALMRLADEGMGVVNTASQEITASVQDFTEKNEPRFRRVAEQVTDLVETVENETAALKSE